jgi:hypothetical protein
VKLSPSVIRFLLETAFIVAVAAATAVARLDKLWIALAVGGAWALVALVERTAKQDRAALMSGRLGFLFSGRGSDARVQDTAWPELPPAPRAHEHPEPPPEPPAPEPAPPAPEPEPPRPEPGEPTSQLRSVSPLPEREPEPAPQREAPPVVAFRPRGDGAPREWNVWHLERLAREREGQDPVRDEELAFLLLELRQFANADGQLPANFDPIVREAFGEFLYSAV